MDLQRIGYAFLKGIYDSLSGLITIFTLNREINEKLRDSPARQNPLIRQKSTSKETTPVRDNKLNEESLLWRTTRCGILNGGIFLLSILVFEYAILGGMGKILGENNSVWRYIQTISLVVYKVLWLIPLFIISKCINTLWFQDIADSAYKHTRGRPQKLQSISFLIADSAFSLVIQTLFLVQASLTSYIPIDLVGYILSMVQMCMLYSLYSFEYKWYNMGWELHRRLSYIETHWPYFIGFGLPLAFVTQLSDSLIIRLLFICTCGIMQTIWMCFSGCIFAVLFPFFIISANGANPVTNTSDIILHIFSPVITISNMIFRTVGLSKKSEKLQQGPRSTSSTPSRR